MSPSRRATLGRWFSWWWANEDLRKVWWSKLSSLIFYMVQVGKMPCQSFFQELDLATKVSQDTQDWARQKANEAKERKTKKRRNNEPPHPGTAEPAESTRPQEEAEQDQKQQQLLPMMQAAAAALARDRNWTRSGWISHFARPMALDHNFLTKAIMQGSGPMAKIYCSYASGQRNQASFDAACSLFCPAALSECGFLLETCHDSHLLACEDDPVTLEQDTLAKSLDTFVFHLLRQRSRGSVQFTDTVVGILATFGAPSPEEACSKALRKL